MKKWAQQIEMQRRRYRERSGTARTSDSSRSGGPGTSVTEFDYMRSIGGQLQNPYADEEDDEDDFENVLASLKEGPGASSKGKKSCIGGALLSLLTKRLQAMRHKLQWHAVASRLTSSQGRSRADLECECH